MKIKLSSSTAFSLKDLPLLFFSCYCTAEIHRFAVAMLCFTLVPAPSNQLYYSDSSFASVRSFCRSLGFSLSYHCRLVIFSSFVMAVVINSRHSECSLEGRKS